MNDLLLRACRREAVERPPVWMMRQAGRYLPEYRKVRERADFLTMVGTPELAVEVTLQPVDILGVDAAIIFSDILVVPQAMGMRLSVDDSTGPRFHQPLRTPAEFAGLRPLVPEEGLGYVLEAIRLARRELEDRVPLIGFAGAPFTLASYAIEGGSSRNYLLTKQLMYSEPKAWHQLMDKFARVITGYLRRQIKAGAQAIQLFDSWVGCLSVGDYVEYVMPHVQLIFEGLKREGVPMIHFGTGTSAMLRQMRAAGGDVIGVDWRIHLDEAWATVGHDVAVQGNLDPLTLFAPLHEIERRVEDILRRAGGRPGHIFNLGHGILPTTPIEHVAATIDMVHKLSQR